MVVDLVELSPLEFVSLHFAGAERENLVCICNRWWSRKELKQIIKPAAAVPVADLCDDAERLAAAHANPTAFWVPGATFRPSALRKDGWFSRMRVNVAEISAVYVDVDVGRAESALTADQAWSVILERCGSGRMPTPSIVTFSGRGLNLVYLLRDDGEGPRRPINATDDTIRRHARLVDRLAEVVADLENDPGAARAIVQPFKFCGTPTGYGTAVKSFTPRADGLLIGGYWTLRELETALRVERSEPRPRLTRGVRATRGTRSRTRARAPWRNRIRELGLLRLHRNGIAEGQRGWFIMALADSMFREKGLGACADSLADIVRTIQELNRSFKPPQPDDEVERRVREAMRHVVRGGKALANDRLALTLGVTTREATALGLKSIVPPSVRAERRERERVEKAATKAKRDLRDELIRLGVPYREIKRRTGFALGTISERAQQLRQDDHA